MTKRIKSISEFHSLRGFEKPEHPLISVITVENAKHLRSETEESLVLDFYMIALKRFSNSKLRYGRQHYDFTNGMLSFMRPNQVFSVVIENEEEELKQSGWVLFIHPDFLWNTTLSKKIAEYEFFEYSVNEALWLSEKEEMAINGIIEKIREEYHANIDGFSKDIIISLLETLLNYSRRFYNRQFLTREKAHHHVLERLDEMLKTYFLSKDLVSQGLPTVQYVAEQLNVSPGYLGSLMRTITGRNTQQYIHGKLIEKAKEKLSATDLSVSEIAYELGFGYSQSFSKFFKTKTKLSPLEFRRSFN